MDPRLHELVPRGQRELGGGIHAFSRSLYWVANQPVQSFPKQGLDLRYLQQPLEGGGGDILVQTFFWLKYDLDLTMLCFKKWMLWLLEDYKLPETPFLTKIKDYSEHLQDIAPEMEGK